MGRRGEYEELRELAGLITRDARTERERAVAVHDFVRDRVRYGFTARFDEASPAETLASGVGHCNAQARLFVELARAAGLEARYHFVTLSGEVLRGVLASPPATISHGYAEVKVDGRWLSVDSYVVDPALAAGAAERLAREGRQAGYGFRLGGRSTWDGASDSFGQRGDPSTVLEDHGSFESPEAFFASDRFLHRLGPVNFSTVMSLVPGPLFRLWSGAVDRRLDSLRASASSRVPRSALSLPAAA